jgi:two-component system KDP operon response regulator KdpE
MPRILILEDYPPLRRVQAATLRRAGWDVVSATSAQESLRAIGHNGFDVLLVDMDIVTGESWRVLQALHASRNHYPIVALLSSAKWRQQELNALGARVILRKPVGRETLLSGVKMALQDANIRIS